MRLTVLVEGKTYPDGKTFHLLGARTHTSEVPVYLSFRWNLESQMGVARDFKRSVDGVISFEMDIKPEYEEMMKDLSARVVMKDVVSHKKQIISGVIIGVGMIPVDGPWHPGYPDSE